MISISENSTTEGAPEYLSTLFDKDYKGIFIDVGAYDNYTISNSYPFELAGWKVYCIEPNPNCAEKLKDRNHYYQLAAGAENKIDVPFNIYSDNAEQSWTGFIPYAGISLKEIVKVRMVTLDYFIESIAFEDHVDILSIDTEGYEMEVLKGIDLDRWKVKVICIENWDAWSIQDEYLLSKGYKRLNRIVFNNFWERI